MASFCNKCGKTIRWERNENNGKWIPFNIRGARTHWETCTGEPAKETKKYLRDRIVETEAERDELKRNLAWANNTTRQLQSELAKYQDVKESFFSVSQTVLRNALAWSRAKVKETGKVRFHEKRLFLAAKKYDEAKERWKNGV